MTTLEQLENKIRNAIPELKEEFEAFEDSSLDRDMITQIGLNHVLLYLCGISYYSIFIREDGEYFYYRHEEMLRYDICWNLKSAYLKDQSKELINFLNDQAIF